MKIQQQVTSHLDEFDATYEQIILPKWVNLKEESCLWLDEVSQNLLESNKIILNTIHYASQASMDYGFWCCLQTLLKQTVPVSRDYFKIGIKVQSIKKITSTSSK